MQKVKLFFIKVVTPLHAGSGSDLGVVDMPIQRESHTSFPKIEASSLKGSIRSEVYSEKLKMNSEKSQNKDEEEIKKETEKEVEAIFGTGDEAGKLGFSDARILFFPVKSVKGVFAYITCPMVLERLKEDLKLGGSKSLEEIKISTSISDEECIVFDENKNKIDNNIILEEYSFKVQDDKLDDTFKIPEIDKTRLVIISDDNFTHFVKNSTEVITRIAINNEKGVVKQGGLFTEEYLPSETVMYALVIGEIEEFIDNSPKILQIGGNTTLGKGIVELSINIKKKEEQNNG